MPGSQKVPFRIVVFCSNIGIKLCSKRSRVSVRGLFFVSSSKQAYWKQGDVQAINPYVHVRNKRIHRADTSAFVPSDFYTSMCVYPYAFMHICIISIQDMALTTSHAGNSMCVNHSSALKMATLRDWKSRICMRKHTRIWISALYSFEF